MEKGNLALKYDGVFLTIQEVARELRLTKNDVTSLIENKQLRAELISNKYCFRVSDVEKFISGETSGENVVDAVSLYKQKLEESGNMLGGKKVIGSITETGGRFIVQFSLGKRPDGKRKRISKTFKSREMAEEYRLKKADELNRKSTSKEYGEYTFKDYSRYYLDLNIYGAKSRTIAGYSEDVRAVNDLIGDIEMKDLSETDIRLAFAELSNIYKDNVLSKKWTITRMILRYATISKHIESNPTDLLKKPESKKFDIKDKESKAYTDEEIDRIFETTNKNKEIDAIFRVLHSTGMRPGELRALRWKDYNRKTKEITILSAVTKVYDIDGDVLETRKYREVISTTKTKYSVRTLELSDAAINALDIWRDHLDNYETEKKSTSQYIFPGHNGDFLKESTYNGKINRFCKCEELKDMGVTSYRFRHTLCTNLVLLGTPEQVILEILGDNTHDLITKVYSHISKDDTRKGLKNLFESKKNYCYNK